MPSTKNETPKLTSDKPRIWIELPVKHEDGRPMTTEEKRQHAALATKMLQKLGDTNGTEFAYGQDGYYWFGGPMGGWQLVNHGHWFNLEYLAR